MNEKTWSIEKWNTELVNAVFLNSSHPKTTITRIDASGRLLASCLGRTNADITTVRKQFIEAFGSDSSVLRSHFAWSRRFENQTLRDGIPPEFAALYLTLLAASADDNTYIEGDFRKRFSALVQPLALNSINFSDLPRMWEHIHEWSKRRAKTSGDCSILLLPDPQRETIIGYSKRLAFPTYKDELHLREVLKKFNLDSDSPFAEVSRAVYSRLKQFTSGFKEELDYFYRFVSLADNQSAFDSPFWGAVRDITIEANEAENRAYGRFCLQLDVSDPQDPRLFLLSDKIGLANPVLGKCKQLDYVRDGFSCLWVCPNADTSVDMLVLLSKKQSEFSKSRTGRALTSGWLIFLPDELGKLSTQGKYCESAPVYFLTRKAQASELILEAKSLGIDYREISSPQVLNGWKLIGVPSCDQRSLRRLTELLPDTLKHSLAGWRPPKPSLSGGSWFGQALLLNPASNPLVRLPDGSNGSYVIYQDNLELATGALVPFNEFYCIPPTDLVGITSATRCKFILEQTESYMQATLEVPVVHESPSGIPRPIRQREEWLIDGLSGALETLSSIYESGEKSQKPPLETTPKYSIRAPKTLFQNTDIYYFSQCNAVTEKDFSQPFEWLCEALSLRFFECSTLHFAELNKYVEMAAQATQINGWMLRKLLFSSLWLSGIQRHSAPFSVAAPADRLISFSQGKESVVARISGMLSKYERNKLAENLLSGEHAFRLEAIDHKFSIGCIELHLTSPSRVYELAEQFGLNLINFEAIDSPMNGLVKLSGNLFEIRSLPQGHNLEIWDQRKREWNKIPAIDYCLNNGDLIRSSGKQRITYWVRVKDSYRETDSRVWAWLLQAAVTDSSLGDISGNGDISWPHKLSTIPSIFSRWWLHLGGGCISIDEQGKLFFVGGSSRRIWDHSIFNQNSAIAKERDDSALKRRALAIRLRKMQRT